MARWLFHIALLFAPLGTVERPVLVYKRVDSGHVRRYDHCSLYSLDTTPAFQALLTKCVAKWRAALLAETIDRGSLCMP